MSGDPGAAEVVPATLEPFGDRALLVTLGQTIDPVINARVHRLAAALRDVGYGLGVPVPGYASLLVPFRPDRVDLRAVERLVGEALDRVAGGDASEHEDDQQPLEIPVRYGRDNGPDLADVCARLGRTESDVIALHSGTTYRVYMLGFSPGFGYLGVLPVELALPRRVEPRVRVPAGSVAIAERQTAVYPSLSAGGWHLIGRTDLSMWDPAANPPARLEAGQRVRFVPA